VDAGAGNGSHSMAVKSFSPRSLSFVPFIYPLALFVFLGEGVELADVQRLV